MNAKLFTYNSSSTYFTEFHRLPFNFQNLLLTTTALKTFHPRPQTHIFYSYIQVPRGHTSHIAVTITSTNEHGNEPNGTRLVVVIRSVPILKNVFGSMQNDGPRQPNRHERYLLHMPRQNGVHTHLRWCPPTSYNPLFFPVWSGHSVLPNKKKGCNISSSSS